ncbi:MAG: hydroxyethylthiazole kinase [Deltaproteobacteria bacterium]|jgi:hydroxyethylthiazole kinase|nr:hydroxyethylthiazole kinase [Deltaproteobacteria bacterium]
MTKTVNGKIDRLVWDAVRRTRPLTLCLTNFVTVTDCANAILAVGGAPVMTLDENDARELAEAASSVVLNTGTVNAFQLAAMLGAGRAARKASRPVLLDPVGCGATRMRMDAARRILEEVGPSIVRCNASEILALEAATGGAGKKAARYQRGVDAGGSETMAQIEEAAQNVSERFSCVVAVSGETDVIAQGKMLSSISGGTVMLTKVTGTGCMLSSLAGTCLGALPDKPVGTSIAAMNAMKEAGERAEAKLSAPGNLGEFRSRLCDELADIAVS